MTNEENQSLRSDDWKQFMKGVWVAALILTIGTMFGLGFLNHRAKQWGKNLRYYPESPRNTYKNTQPNKTEDTQTNINIYLEQFKDEPNSHNLRIQEQIKIIRSRAQTHLRSTKDFYIWSSLVSGIALLGSVISASCLLHISRKGWESASSTIQGIFVVSAGTVAFCSSCILLYQYEKNIANNASLYVYYINLEDNVLGALSTQSPLFLSTSNSTETEETGSTNLKSIILYVQKSLNELNTLDIELDLEQDFKFEDLLQQSDDQQ